MPAASSRRTRSRQARGDSATVAASFSLVERPSRCKAAKILMSIRSSAGGRLTAIGASIGILDRNRIVEAEPAAVSIYGVAGDVARVIGSEKHRDRGDLLGLADAPERG